MEYEDELRVGEGVSKDVVTLVNVKYNVLQKARHSRLVNTIPREFHLVRTREDEGVQQARSRIDMWDALYLVRCVE
jgi:hypothetical protein